LLVFFTAELVYIVFSTIRYNKEYNYVHKRKIYLCFANDYYRLNRYLCKSPGSEIILMDYGRSKLIY